MRRTARIGYEKFIKRAFVLTAGDVSTPTLDTERFRNHLQDYTVVDVRNGNEVAERRIFDNSINIPLPELRERLSEIPKDKPIVVHCAGGYRSAAGSSLVASALNGSVMVYDLGEAVRGF